MTRRRSRRCRFVVLLLAALLSAPATIRARLLADGSRVGYVEDASGLRLKLPARAGRLRRDHRA